MPFICPTHHVEYCNGESCPQCPKPSSVGTYTYKVKYVPRDVDQLSRVIADAITRRPRKGEA